MSLLRNLSISRKLAFAFGIVCLLSLLQAGLAILGFTKLNGAI
jgi:hypothetical protein